MMRRWLAAAGVCVFGAGAQAADLRIVDIKASLYLEATGKFSEPLADGAELENLAKGDGPDRRLASAVLVELTFSGAQVRDRHRRRHPDQPRRAGQRHA